MKKSSISSNLLGFANGSTRFAAFLVTAVMLLFAASCEDDQDFGPDAPLTIEFVGQMAGQPLALESETYLAPSAVEGFRLSRLSFFISEVQLVTANGSLTKISDVEYVELGPDGRSALRIPSVPNGNYAGLRLRFGITAAQDSMEPKDFPAGSALAKSAEYWVDWGSYVFLKIEGKTDTLADGRARFEQPFLYHIGRAATYGRELSFDMPIKIGDGVDGKIALNLDVSEMLGLKSTAPLSVSGAIDHRNDSATRIMDNTVRALTPGR